MAGLVPAIPNDVARLCRPKRNARDKPGMTKESQNKKYRCAIGSTSAGAQVSNSPSALTS
jgi:hypothetical protein